MGTSFSPDKRGADFIASSSAELAEDLAGMPEEQREAYQAGYERHIRAWLVAKGNCMSSMITGPANFPIRRAEKANRAEHARMEEFTQWRDKELKRIRKANEPQVDPLEAARKRLATRKEAHEIMKTANAIVRKGGGVPELMAAGISEKLATEIMQPNRFGGNTFTFELKNNLAEIKRWEARVAELEAKAAKVGSNREMQLDGCRVVLNYDIDRVQIVHDAKPTPDVISALKSGGFRWSPREKAWQRQLTTAGLIAAARVTGADIKELAKLHTA